MTLSAGPDELEIVGATPAPEDEIAPHRLNPVFRRRGSPDVYYTLAAEEDSGPLQLALIARSDLEALVSLWYARRADPDDPLPLLLLVWVLRDDPDVALLHGELRQQVWYSTADRITTAAPQTRFR